MTGLNIGRLAMCFSLLSSNVVIMSGVTRFLTRTLQTVVLAVQRHLRL